MVHDSDNSQVKNCGYKLQKLRYGQRCDGRDDRVYKLFGKAKDV